MEEEARVCDLCGGEASLYCPADSAFLCFNCDSEVHGANFLVARHVRQAVCSNCKSLTGIKSPPLLSICQSCDLNSSSPSSSLSSCISSTESTVNRWEKVKLNGSKRDLFDGKAEAVLANWCRKLRLDSAAVMPVAMEAIGVCLSELTFLPFRLLLTASLWFSLKLKGEWKWRALRRLEEVSGTSSKLILATESKLARLLSRRRITAGDLPEEGWGEC